MSEKMNHTLAEMSPSLASHKDTLSSKALSTLRVMAFLDSRRVQCSLFDPLRQWFAVNNKELNLDFPSTATLHKEACAELMEASFLQYDTNHDAYGMKLKVEDDVVADVEKAGLISAIFNGIVNVLWKTWPNMIRVPQLLVSNDEIKVATASGTSYEGHLEKRYSDSQLPPLEDFTHAKPNYWAQRNVLIHHISKLHQMYYLLNNATRRICTIPFAMLLAEASWYINLEITVI